MEQPLLQWTPSIAPSDMIFYEGDIYPELKKHFLQDVLRFAVNQEYVSENLNLKPIDEIAIFPPVSGG